MSGVHFDLPFCLGIDPSIRDAPAGKDEGMGTVFVDDGQLKISIEGGRRYEFPHGRRLPAI